MTKPVTEPVTEPVTQPLLAVRGLTVVRGGRPVLRGVDLTVSADTLGHAVIGESGAGKSTLALSLLRLLRPAAGTVELSGRDVLRLGGRGLRAFRGEAQIVLPDGDSPLDPRLTVRAAVSEALAAHRVVPREERAGRVASLLGEVGLDPALASRRPHQLSGGQRQRVVIARALAVRPRLLVADEPTSALDVVTQRRLVQLLRSLAGQRSLTYLLVSHNLAVVRALCERISVLFAGKVVEAGPTGAVLDSPRHPYTVALAAAGRPGGAAPHADLPIAASGCRYRRRCPYADKACEVDPDLREVAPDRWAACHHPVEPPDAEGPP